MAQKKTTKKPHDKSKKQKGGKVKPASSNPGGKPPRL